MRSEQRWLAVCLFAAGHAQSFVEYGLDKASNSPTLDWQLMEIREVQALQPDLAAYYNLNGGFRAINDFSFAARCLRCADGALLLDGLELGLNTEGSGSSTAISEVSDDGTFYYFQDLDNDHSRVLYINATRSFTNDSSVTTECSSDDAPGLWFRQRFALGNIQNATYWSQFGWVLTTDDELEADREYFDIYYNMYSGLPVIGTYEAGSSCQIYFGADENDAMEARYNETYDFTEYQVCPFRGTTRVTDQVNDGEYLQLGLLTISDNYPNRDSDNFASLDDETRFIMDNSGSTYDDEIDWHTLYTRGQTWIGYTWPPTSSPTLITDAPSSLTTAPTTDPTENPTTVPTRFPTKYPSDTPSVSPSVNPSMVPSGSPTQSPVSSGPTQSPIIITTSQSPTQSPQSGSEARGDSGGNSNDDELLIIILVLSGVAALGVCCAFMHFRRRELEKKDQKIKKLKKEVRMQQLGTVSPR